jgi:uncharacterized membrane protein
VYLGISDLVFVIINRTVSDTLGLAFSFLPTVVLFTKITPHYVEATVFATLTGAFNFSVSVGGPMLGSIFCRIVGVNSSNLDGYYILLLIQLIAITLTFLYIFLVPKRSEIMEAQ